jgi:hypothetical protein
MAVTIQSVLRQHGEHYFSRHSWPVHVLRAAQQMRDCRTAALGGHLERCPHGHFEKVHYNSCHHRACPTCNGMPAERWLGGWKARLLQTGHHHLVFTVPNELAVIWRFNRALFARLLFSAVHETLQELLSDPKYLGAVPGMLASLHTWGQQLQIHPHVHVLVTSGGLDQAGQWQEAKKKCLLPRKVLMMIFRGKLRARLRRASEQGDLVLPDDWKQARFFSLLNKLGRVEWNAKVLEPYEHGAGVATYLARYTRGGPIKNQRLLSLSGGRITFRYQDNRELDPCTDRPRQKTIGMSVDEFLTRLLQHVPPKGLQTIRSWGLYASAKRADLATARRVLGQPPLEKVEPPSWSDYLMHLGYPDPRRCPECGCELIIISIPPAGRGPPAGIRRAAA